MTTTETPTAPTGAPAPRYTRAQNLADGFLIAAHPSMAQAVGWRSPVAFSAAVHQVAIAWSKTTDADKGVLTRQSRGAREFDLLRAAGAAALGATDTDRVAVTVLAVPPTGPSAEAVEVDLVVHAGPGDTPESVITIMLPSEV